MPALTRSVILAGAMSCISVPVLADMIDDSGMAPWEVCGLCHSLDGISAMPKFPKLAGQNAAYIVEQLNNFRDGSRTNDGGQMEAIVSEVEPADIDAVATYFASLPPPAPSLEQGNSGVQSAAEKPGERLFAYGKTGVRACAECHSNASGKTPRLFAQHEAYLVKQLVDFASGKRGVSKLNSEEESITCIDNARRLEPLEITALATFLATSKAPLNGPSASTEK